MSGAFLMDKVRVFYDFYHNQVKFSFAQSPFSKSPRHVWVICKYKGKWLLTKHPDRGIEFPGGKVEDGETPEAAAKREVYEETGGITDEFYYLGQYQVEGKSDTIVKNVYVAEIKVLEEKKDYMETEGPVILDSLPDNIKANDQYSFMMKDDVLNHSLQFIKKHSILKNTAN